jgi:hypothetical protein
MKITIILTATTSKYLIYKLKQQDVPTIAFSWQKIWQPLLLQGDTCQPISPTSISIMITQMRGQMHMLETFSCSSNCTHQNSENVKVTVGPQQPLVALFGLRYKLNQAAE